MKRNLLWYLALAALMIVNLSVVIAGDDDVKIKKVKKIEANMEEFEEEMEAWGEEMDKWGEELENSLDSGKEIPPMPAMPGGIIKYGSDDQSPKFGIYIEDLDFQEAYEMHYDECYGVLITGVVEGGNADRAGLIENDILMEFDGEKVRFEDHLLNLRDSKKIGDTVTITFFRNEKVMTTQMTFQPYEEEDEVYYHPDKKESQAKKLSPGFGGGYINALYVDYDFEDINNFIAQYDFDPELLEDAVFFGGGGHGNVGGGWFIGGAGAGYMVKKKISYDTDGDGSLNGQRRLLIESGFGGVTITKKLAVGTERLVMDMGTLIGGGATSIELSQSNGSFNWDQNQSDLNDGENWHANFEKSYLVIHPTIGAMIRIKNWIGLKGSAGYLWTYSIDDDWTEKPFDFTVQGESPDVIGGPSYSVGIWFGF